MTTHPEIMARVQAEVDAVLEGQQPSLSHLKELVYTEQVIKETLRMYPPIHLGSRSTTADLEIEGKAIPAGTRLLYSIYLTHRDKQHWPDPDRFDPDRFSAENARAHDPYAYLPFGGAA